MGHSSRKAQSQNNDLFRFHWVFILGPNAKAVVWSRKAKKVKGEVNIPEPDLAEIEPQVKPSRRNHESNLPLSQWTPIAIKYLSSSGNFSLTIKNTVTAVLPLQFYILQTQ
jgi:hypothetical protein